jgi:hypothetical protein
MRAAQSRMKAAVTKSGENAGNYDKIEKAIAWCVEQGDLRVAYVYLVIQDSACGDLSDILIRCVLLSLVELADSMPCRQLKDGDCTESGHADDDTPLSKRPRASPRDQLMSESMGQIARSLVQTVNFTIRLLMNLELLLLLLLAAAGCCCYLGF